MHPLDRPVWSALTTRQAPLAIGTGGGRRFPAAISPLGAAELRDDASLVALLDAGEPLVLLEVGGAIVPPGTQLLRARAGVQMIWNAPPPAENGGELLPLGASDAAEMLALATLTEPGPFAIRTHELGGFLGLRRDGRLIAMAGERLKPAGWAEVSGVCTHPDHRGQGHARRLMRAVIARIAARGDRPFLHTYADNHGAIALYEALGFVWRADVTMSVLARG